MDAEADEPVRDKRARFADTSRALRPPPEAYQAVFLRGGWLVYIWYQFCPVEHRYRHVLLLGVRMN